MKAPRKFFAPLAIGAPRPYAELPARLERMIHFVPPHNEKVRAKVGELARQVDVVLGNLEDAIPIESKVDAREGFIAMAKANDFGSTGLWARVNALNSPWLIDDLTRIVGEIGDKLDVVMVPKVEGPWDIHFIDQYLALLEARAGVKKPILVHAILETAEGVNNVVDIAAASPRMQGMSLGPADLAASRAMKTTRVGGGHPDYRVLADISRRQLSARQRAAGPLALYDRAHGRRLRRQRPQGVLRPVRRFLRSGGLRGAIPQRLFARLRRRLDAAPEPDRHRQAGFFARPRRGQICAQDSGGDAGRVGRGDDRRQDAGRRDVETGQGDFDLAAPGRGEGQGLCGALRLTAI